MTKRLETVERWGIKWRDRSGSHLMFDNLMPLIFLTRKEAKAWIDSNYGYIRTRKDLRSAPYNWRLPIPVRVMVVESR